VVAANLPSRYFTVTPVGLVFTEGTSPDVTMAEALRLFPLDGGPDRLLVDGLDVFGAVASLDGLIYFTGGPETAPQDLWVSDGTAAGTRVAVPLGISVGGPIAPANPRGLARRDGDVVLLADDDSISHPDPWRTDGTSAGTSELDRDGLRGSTASSTSELVPFPGGTLWRRGNGSLWLFERPGDVAVRLEGLESAALNALALGSRLLFSAAEVEPRGTRRHGVFSTDGTVEGTVELFAGGPVGVDDPGALTRFQGRLYYWTDVSLPLGYADHALFSVDLDGGDLQRVAGFPPERLSRDVFQEALVTPARSFYLASTLPLPPPDLGLPRPTDPDDEFPRGDSLLTLEHGSGELVPAAAPDALAARATGVAFDFGGRASFRGRLALEVASHA
jgi:hypothetical protein